MLLPHLSPDHAAAYQHAREQIVRSFLAEGDLTMLRQLELARQINDLYLSFVGEYQTVPVLTAASHAGNATAIR